LLIAEGYDKVIVTQPRRLPCKSIPGYINKIMITNTNSNEAKLAGYAMSGEDENSKAKILYVTDGLLKERLLNEDNFLTI
jgi:HrpA-like RNA helicase